jgi:hypothetical protein
MPSLGYTLRRCPLRPVSGIRATAAMMIQMSRLLASGRKPTLRSVRPQVRRLLELTGLTRSASWPGDPSHGVLGSRAAVVHGDRTAFASAARAMTTGVSARLPARGGSIEHIGVVISPCTSWWWLTLAPTRRWMPRARARRRSLASAPGMSGWRGLAGVQELLRRMAGTDPAAVWLVTTDADSLVPGDWLRRQLAYANQGWDVVLGTVAVADWEDHPAHVTAAYQALYEFFDLLCTEPANSCSGCPIPGAASFPRTSVWTMTRSGNCRGLRSPGKPNWEPNWLPTATSSYTGPHSTWSERPSGLTWHHPATLRLRLILKQVSGCTARRGQASHGLCGPPQPRIVAGSYWVAMRARSKTPAVVPTYMSRVIR